VEAAGATFFEAITAVALLYFARERVQLAVLETGLGGRLDATNAAGARAVLLTSVGDDHHQILGDSLPAIAREKLGLARPGMPFYVGELPEELRELARSELAAAGAKHVDLSAVQGAIVGSDGRHARVRMRVGRTSCEAELPQRGRMQAQMAALAVACWTDLAPRLSLPLGDVGGSLQGARVACRYEVHGRNPELVLDTAHNAPALERVLEQWSAERPWHERVLVFGVMRDKRLDSVLPTIARAAAEVIVTAPRWERSLEPRQLADRLREHAAGADADPITVHERVTGALEYARARARAMQSAGSQPSVLVTGSNFLVAEVLDRLGVDDVFATGHSPLWDAGLSLRDRPEREVASPWTG
jgi:dihydrofolate synthase/folylpolyglutamate synthase